MEEKVYLKNHLFAAFFVGLAIGLGSYYVWDNKNDAGKENGNGTDTADFTADNGGLVSKSANSVTVLDQFAGFTAIVDTITMEKDGWVVIYSDDDGKPGSRLGASRRNFGTSDKIEVELLQNTEEGETYYAMIHADDGDRQFDHMKDIPVLTSEGNPVMTAFEIVRR